jgi:outer membrane immunogenic protein
MKVLSRALLATAAVVGLVSSASAADLAYKVKAPMMAAPVFSWTGFYIGVEGGGGTDWNGTRGLFDPQTTSAANPTSIGPTTAVGAVNPLNDPSGVTGFTNVPTPAGFQSLGSITFGNNANRGVQFFNNTPAGGFRLAGPTTYAQAPTSLGSVHPFGSGGLEAGYNYQVNWLVFGVGAKFDWLASKGFSDNWQSQGGYSAGATANAGVAFPGNPTGPCPAPPFSSCQVTGNSQANGSTTASTNWIGTITAKLGVAGDRTMAYITGGLAYGQVRLGANANYTDANFLSGISCNVGGVGCYTSNQFFGTSAAWNGSVTQNKTGWTVGAGFNQMVTQNVYVKAEGSYYDLGRVTTTIHGTGTQVCNAGSTNGQPGSGNPAGTPGAFGTCGFGAGGGVVTGGNGLGGTVSGPFTTPVAVADYTVSKQYNGIMANIGIGLKF